jgi:hypothetical protein
MDQRAELRVKNNELPSGENVGEPSLAGPEMIPGGDISADGGSEPRRWLYLLGCGTGKRLERGQQTHLTGGTQARSLAEHLDCPLAEKLGPMILGAPTFVWLEL